ncbi:MAG: amino acid--tRNA ligase-related protein [Chlamydiia bacterium]
MSLEQTKSLTRSLLESRALFFQKIRSFFFEKQVLEVDTPILVSFPPNDASIDIMRVITKMGDRYLASSPEYLMKRLLAQGSNDIFQLSHVYRDGEMGIRHSPFFTMLEWYRCDFSLERLIQEVLDLIHTLEIIGPVTYGSYRQRFIDATQIDPLNTTKDELIDLLQKRIHSPQNCSLEALIDAVFIEFVEPTMHHGIHIISSFLPHQAALAKIEESDALRFEIYVDGVEVANGYEELNDPKEITDRFTEWNKDRATPLNVDPRFIEALPHMPPTSGVAVGVDRLLMIRQKASTLASILPFDYSSC